MLVDTNVLLRSFQPNNPQLRAAENAVRNLPKQGRELHIVPQNLVELWAVATRPVDQNGFGMTTGQVAAEMIRLKSLFNFLFDAPAIHPVWEALVIEHRVSGKATHDARLVAAMRFTA